MLFNGFQINEYAVSQSWMSSKSGMAIGITGRYLDIESFYHTEEIWDLDEYSPADLLEKVESGDSIDENEWTIDVGILFVGRNNRLGITGRNLNSYEFDFNDEVKMKVKPEYRIGYAYTPSDRFTWTVDYQINESRDPTGNKLDGKTMATGFEGRLGETRWLAIRGGAIYEMDAATTNLYTGGIGLILPNLQLDATFASDQDGVGERIGLGLRLRF